MIQTSSSNITYHINSQTYKGRTVYVEALTNPFTGELDMGFCDINQHDLEVVHHYDEEGNHYCPTMFLMCSNCVGHAEEPEPFECIMWGTK